MISKKTTTTKKASSNKKPTTKAAIAKGIPTRMPPKENPFSKQKIENHGLVNNLSGVATLKKSANKTNQNR